MMKNLNLLLLAGLLIFGSCSSNDDDTIVKKANIAIVVASGKTDPNVIVPIENIMTDVISPIGKGIEQGGKRRFYYTINNTLISTDYREGDLIGYEFVDGILKEKGALSFIDRRSLIGTADDKTLVVVNHPRSGIEDRTFNFVDTDKMEIVKKVSLRLDEREAEQMLSWPTGLKVVNNKMFVSYMLLSADGKFKTTNSNKSRVAVLNYPELTLDKLISDDRGSDIGLYGNFNGLVATESGDIYSSSSSSLANGFSPTPTNKSNILKIANGTTEFDKNYYFDFETVSGGYKINFMHYIGNNKALVKMVTDDSGTWASFNPIPENPILKVAIVDLQNKTVKEITNIPLHGGQWSTPAVNYNGKIYINVSDSNGAYIYEIDTDNATAIASKKIIGSEVRSIFISK